MISPGTERMLIELSSKSTMGKARARPEAVRQVLGTVRREGVQSALSKVRARLDHPYPLGYSLAGTVLEAGTELQGPMPGTRVACAGAEIATHAEVVSVPPLLALACPAPPLAPPVLALTCPAPPPAPPVPPLADVPPVPAAPAPPPEPPVPCPGELLHPAGPPAGRISIAPRAQR